MASKKSSSGNNSNDSRYSKIESSDYSKKLNSEFVSYKFNDQRDKEEQQQSKASSSKASQSSSSNPSQTTEEYNQWEEDHTNRVEVRRIGKSARHRFDRTIVEKGGSKDAKVRATGAVYEGMGGRPKPKSRDKWTVVEQKRTAVSEETATNWIGRLFLWNDPPPSNQVEERIRDDAIVDTARKASEAANDLMNDEDEGGVGKWFGHMFGTTADKEPDPKQLELELPTEPESKSESESEPENKGSFLGKLFLWD